MLGLIVAIARTLLPHGLIDFFLVHSISVWLAIAIVVATTVFQATVVIVATGVTRAIVVSISIVMSISIVCAVTVVVPIPVARFRLVVMPVTVVEVNRCAGVRPRVQAGGTVLSPAASVPIVSAVS